MTSSLCWESPCFARLVGKGFVCLLSARATHEWQHPFFIEQCMQRVLKIDPYCLLNQHIALIWFWLILEKKKRQEFNSEYLSCIIATEPKQLHVNCCKPSDKGITFYWHDTQIWTAEVKFEFALVVKRAISHLH